MVMKKLAFTLLMAICLGQQVAGQKNEVSEADFFAKENLANDLLKRLDHRSTKTLEYFEDRDKPGRVVERHVREVSLPKKWRTIDETNYEGKSTREERLWDGATLYVKRDAGDWERFDGGSSVSGRHESGKITKTYWYLGKNEVNREQADSYQVQKVRIANKYSVKGFLAVRYVTDSFFWFAADGRLLKKAEETVVDGHNAMNRETTTLDYSTRPLIEAPIE